MLLNDRQILVRCLFENPMVHPFEGNQITKSVNGTKVISFGLSSVGYDITLGRKIRAYQPSAYECAGEHRVIDPSAFDDSLLSEIEVPEGSFLDIPAHGYVLGVSGERFQMPNDVAALCLTKSTYARAGLLCNTTPLEPGWTGYLTLELANLTPLPIRIYPGQGIAQILFFKVDRPNVTYADRSGKYQNQPNVPVSPKMKS